jgi:hypothetical protein
MIVMARFTDGSALHQAVHRAREAGHRPLEAFTPVPIEGLTEILGSQPNLVRAAMAAAGFGVAAMAYALEWYSAVLAYPIDSGGRPLHSWPAFVFFPFSVGILAAAIAGLITLFLQGGLLSLHHPAFDLKSIEVASQDAFLLALAPSGKDGTKSLQALLRRQGAEETWEVGP